MIDGVIDGVYLVISGFALEIEDGTFCWKKNEPILSGYVEVDISYLYFSWKRCDVADVCCVCAV